MSLFKNLFSSKPKGPEYQQLVWLNRNGKLKAFTERILQKVASGEPVVVFSWFPKTHEELSYILTQLNVSFANGLATGHGSIILELAHNYLNKTPNPNTFAAKTDAWVMEHYPLHLAELELFGKLQQDGLHTNPIVFTDLDEELFGAFGGENIKRLVTQMGFGKDEFMEHNMIKQSTQKAQAKIAQNVTIELQTNSSELWFATNYSHINRM